MSRFMVSIAATAQRRRKTHNVPIWVQVHSFSHRLYDKQLTLTPIIITEEKKKMSRTVKQGRENWK